MTQDELCGAISNRRVITFWYEERIVTAEPYVLGIDVYGSLSLRAWQLFGARGKGWRRFQVSKATRLSITDVTFEEPREGYESQDEYMQRVIFSV